MLHAIYDFNWSKYMSCDPGRDCLAGTRFWCMPMGFIDVFDGISCVKRNELYSATAHVEDFSATRHT